MSGVKIKIVECRDGIMANVLLKKTAKFNIVVGLNLYQLRKKNETIAHYSN